MFRYNDEAQNLLYTQNATFIWYLLKGFKEVIYIFLSRLFLFEEICMYLMSLSDVVNYINIFQSK